MSTSSPPDRGSPNGGDYLSRRWLGGFFLVFSAVLLASLVYFLFEVVVPLTGPSLFFEELARTYYEKLQSENSEPDQLTLNFVLLLEYANADIRTAGVQVAFSLFGGLALMVIGVLLLTAGVTGTLRLSGKHLGAGFDLKAATPGIACLVLGAGILAMGIHKDVSRSVGATIERGIDVTYGSQEGKPAIAKQGEGPVDSHPDL